MFSFSSQSFQVLRNQLLDDLLLGFGLLGTPAAFLAARRFVDGQFWPVPLLHLLLLLVVWVAWCFRRRLPFHVKTSMLLFALWGVLIAGLLRLGPAADGKLFIVFFAFAAMLFLRQKVAWVVIALAAVTMISCGYVASQRWIQFPIDYKVYAHEPVVWGSMIWSAISFSLLWAYVLGRLVSGIFALSGESRAMAERFRRISSRIPGVIYQFRLDPDGRVSIPYISDMTSSLLELPKERLALEGEPLFSMVHPDDLASVRSSIAASAEQLSPWQEEFRMLLPSRGERWMHGNATPTKESDGAILWHGFISDITEQKRLQKIKEEFISVVSHELRTPLTSIRGALKLYLSGMLDVQPEKKQHLLEIADKNSERLLFLINDLLDVERLVRDEPSLQKQPVGLCSFLETCLEENRSFAQQYDVSLVLESCEEVELNLDPQRMRQVVDNLISNACKHSPVGGVVGVRCQIEDERVVLSVTDHGTGIPKSFQDKVFDKFSQADSGNTRRATGTGLGLSIVKQIVLLHRGKIWFETEEGVGTSFFVSLPYRGSSDR